jgi:hypothetical protein
MSIGNKEIYFPLLINGRLSQSEAIGFAIEQAHRPKPAVPVLYPINTWTGEDFVGQVVNLRRIVNPPAIGRPAISWTLHYTSGTSLLAIPTVVYQRLCGTLASSLYPQDKNCRRRIGKQFRIRLLSIPKVLLPFAERMHSPLACGVQIMDTQ